MIDLFKKPKKLSWWTSLKLLWTVMFARLYYWWTGKIRIQYMMQNDETYGSVRLSGTHDVVRIVKLPAKFKMLSLTREGGRMFVECEVLSSEDGDLEWLEATRIRLNDHSYELLRSPSLILCQHPDQEPVEIQDKVFLPAAEQRLRFTASNP
jgi:hypothetical protein